jgi:hypothetical protein
VLTGLCKGGGQRGQIAVRQAGDDLVEERGGSHACGYCGVAGGGGKKVLVVDSLNAVRSQVLLRGLRDLPVEGDDKLQVAGSFAAARAARTYYYRLHNYMPTLKVCQIHTIDLIGISMFMFY